ncbi:type II toxin-antitoxin system RelE/ParE family toxin [Candidatus Woesearchaeota archaeon]|nr:type II toxin-antitoxin system RelE/ParE family toxin [Candidatus Woesearchaeota archaeon]
MSYEIIFSNLADKQLSKFSIDIQIRIVSTIKRCQIRPYEHIKKLVGCKYFRLRVGDYRVIMDVIENKLIIHVIEIGNRKNIYKNNKHF